MGEHGVGPLTRPKRSSRGLRKAARPAAGGASRRSRSGGGRPRRGSSDTSREGRPAGPAGRRPGLGEPAPIAGLVVRRGRNLEVEPLFQEGPSLLLARDGVKSQSGDLVLYAHAHGRRARVSRIIGRKTVLADVLEALLLDNLAQRGFGPEVEAEAAEAAGLEGRRDTFRSDLRHLFTFTVDPATARDFDDALSFVAGPAGLTTVYVHIADVSYYVGEGTALDEEALRRATSVYVATGVEPMLPPMLSSGVCSLQPGRDRKVGHRRGRRGPERHGQAGDLLPLPHPQRRTPGLRRARGRVPGGAGPLTFVGPGAGAGPAPGPGAAAEPLRPGEPAHHLHRAGVPLRPDRGDHRRSPSGGAGESRLHRGVHGPGQRAGGHVPGAGACPRRVPGARPARPLLGGPPAGRPLRPGPAHAGVRPDAGHAGRRAPGQCARRPSGWTGPHPGGGARPPWSSRCCGLRPGPCIRPRTSGTSGWPWGPTATSPHPSAAIPTCWCTGPCWAVWGWGRSPPPPP